MSYLHRTEAMLIRLTKENKQRLRALADANGSTMNTWVNNVVEQAWLDTSTN